MNKEDLTPTQAHAEESHSLPSTTMESRLFPAWHLIPGILILTAGVIATFYWSMRTDPPYFMGMKDTWRYYGPILSFMDHAIHEDGELPFWNPLYFCGQPHAANPQSFVFYPPNLLRSLLTFHPTPLKTQIGAGILVLAEILFTGIGVLLLARRHRYSSAAALVSAFAYAFSSALMARAVCHWIFLNCACWLPWTMLALYYAVHAKNTAVRIAAAALAGLSFGCCILGGVPVLIFLCGLSIAFYWCGETILLPMDGDNYRSRCLSFFRNIVSSGLLFALTLLLAGMLAAPMLLPLGEFSPLTSRINAGVGLEDLSPLSYGWDLLKALLFYEGHPKYEGIRAGGAAVLAFAILALLIRPRWNGFRWAILFIILLDASVSTPFFFGDILRFFAPFISNNPGRGMAIACLPLALLAGWGVDALLRQDRSIQIKFLISGIVLLVGGGIIGMAAYMTPIGRIAVTPMMLILPAGALLTALAGIWIGRPLIPGIIIALCIFGESYAWNMKALPNLMDKDSIYPKPLDELETPKSFPLDNRRIAAYDWNRLLYDLRFIMNGYDPLYLVNTRNTLTPVPLEPEKRIRRVVRGSEPTEMSQRGNLFFKRRFWLSRNYCIASLPAHNRLFPPTGTAFFQEPVDFPVPPVSPDTLENTGILEKGEEIPLLDTLSGPVTFNAGNISSRKYSIELQTVSLKGRHSSLFLRLKGHGTVTIRTFFKDPSTDGAQFGAVNRISLDESQGDTVEIPAPDMETLSILLQFELSISNGRLQICDARLVTDNADENNRLTITRQTANRVDVTVKDLPGPRILSLLDSNYPGWHAFVDDGEVSIYTVAEAFKAIWVPEGTHQISFLFRPVRVGIGVSLALIALIFCAGAVGIAYRKRNRGGESTPRPCSMESRS